MTRAQRITGMISVALADALLVAGIFNALHRELWWGAMVAVLVATAFGYLVTLRHPGYERVAAQRRAWRQRQRALWRQQRLAWREQRRQQWQAWREQQRAART